MKNYIYLFITLIVICVGCKSKNQPKKSDYFGRLNIVIEDFYRKHKSDIKKYNLFYLDYKEMENRGYYFYSILPMEEKSYAYTIDINPKLSNLPSDYIKFKGKVFFIEDENVRGLKAGLLEYLDSLQLLDSTVVKVQMGLVKPEDVDLIMDHYDDSLEGVNYIICKKEPNTIREKIRSSSYIPPDDKRFEDLCK